MASSTCALLKSGVSFPGIALPGQDLPRFSSNSSARKMTHPTWVQSRGKQITSIASRQRFVCLKCMAAITEEPKPTIAKERGSFSRRGALLAAVVATGLSVANISPAQAGILSGSPGLEQAEAPSVPEIGLFKQIQEGNKKRQDAWDSDFEQSDLLKSLLKKSAENKEKNSKEIRDKYCVRGSEWGVGDCAVKGLPDSVESSQATRKLLSDAIDKLRGK